VIRKYGTETFVSDYILRNVRSVRLMTNKTRANLAPDLEWPEEELDDLMHCLKEEGRGIIPYKGMSDYFGQGF
jgi:hypothetical protein